MTYFLSVSYSSRHAPTRIFLLFSVKRYIKIKRVFPMNLILELLSRRSLWQRFCNSLFFNMKLNDFFYSIVSLYTKRFNCKGNNESKTKLLSKLDIKNVAGI